MNSPLLGVDLGFKRTGVALSESGILVRPLTVLEADPPHMEKVMTGLIDLVQQYEIQTVVVGLPYTEEGKDTGQSNKVRSFLDRLTERLPKVTIETVNEFYSTVEARSLYPDTELDAAAAAVILQSYLDQHV